MTDFWLTQTVLSTIGWVYLAVGLISIGFAFRLPGSKKSKLICGLITLAGFSVLPAKGLLEHFAAKDRRKEYERTLKPAEARFRERCKLAKREVLKTVRSEGIFLENVRPRTKSYANQFALDDPYGADIPGDGYITTFLRVDGEPLDESDPRFSYADVKVDGTIRRYIKVRKRWPSGTSYVELEEVPVVDPIANYAVAFQDISQYEDRIHWIAGGRLVVRDRNDGTLLAERIGFIFDPGLGSKAGGRGPWEKAIPCVATDDRAPHHTRRFVTSAVHPK